MAEYFLGRRSDPGCRPRAFTKCHGRSFLLTYRRAVLRKRPGRGMECWRHRQQTSPRESWDIAIFGNGSLASHRWAIARRSGATSRSPDCKTLDVRTAPGSGPWLKFMYHGNMSHRTSQRCALVCSHARVTHATLRMALDWTFFRGLLLAPNTRSEAWRAAACGNQRRTSAGSATAAKWRGCRTGLDREQ